MNEPLLCTIPDSLVNLIYDTALDDSLWTELLEQTTQFIGSLQQERAESEAETVVETLLNHFQRSTQILGKLDTIETQQQAQQRMFEQLPLPSILLNGQGDVLLINQQAEHYLQHSRSIQLKKKTLKFHAAKQQAKFREVVKLLSDPAELTQEQTLVVKGGELVHPVSLKFVRARDSFHSNGQIIIFIAGYEHWLGESDVEAFADVYGLTQAETRLVSKLVQEKRLNQIAEEHGVSIHTIRTQLKAVFGKTNTCRQAELQKLILTYKQAAKTRKSSALQELYKLSCSCFHQRLSLGNRGELGYSDTGDPNGIPVIMMHASTGSRLQQHPQFQLLIEKGIRLITPERPGFGLSTPSSNWAMEDFAQNIGLLADRLGIERFIVAGFCGGAPYALQTSQTLADRVIHTCLISPITPYHPINLMYGVKASNKLLANIALKTPKLLTSFTTFIAKNIITEPERYFDQVYSSLGSSDIFALSEPEVTDGFLLAFQEAIRQGPQALAEELSKTAQQWPFALSSILGPVTIFHGQKDCHVSIDHVYQLSSALPHCKLMEYAEHGHLLIYHCWKEILKHFQEVFEQKQG